MTTPITPAKRWTVVLQVQGAITLPGPSDNLQTGTVNVPMQANTSYTCFSSSLVYPPSCTYDPNAQVLTIKGAPGDTVTWQAWTLTAAP